MTDSRPPDRRARGAMIARWLAGASCVLLVTAGTPALAARYDLSLLPPQGMAGGRTEINDINNRGQAVGVSGGVSVIWNGTEASVVFADATRQNWLSGINDAGVAVGIRGTRAVRWVNGRPTELDSLGGPRSHNVTYAINNQGQAVGVSAGAAVLWDGGTVTPLQGGGIAFDINEAGQAVGYDSRNRAVRWDGTTAHALDSITAGTSWANAINDAGVAVGYNDGAVRWDGAQATRLQGGLYANDINEAGVIVGTSGVSFGTARALMWKDGQVIDLNTFVDRATADAGWILADASALNDRGWIVGRADNVVLGRNSLYILSVVPEPPAFAGWLAGIALLTAVRRRRASRTRPAQNA